MQYIILLRGINVGGRKILMAELKACFEKAGYKNVKTVLQTGNVIVESGEKDPVVLRKHIETILNDTFNYPALVLVLQPEQLKKIMQKNPFKEADTQFHRYIVFTEKGFEKEMVRQADVLDKTIEAVSAGKEVIYWRVLKGQTLDSTFGKYMGKAAAKHFMTNRNMNTLEKILKKCE